MGVYATNGLWYISSMLIAMAIIVPLYLKFPKCVKELGVSLIGLLILGWLMIKSEQMSGPGHFYTLIYKGNLRALSEIAIGALALAATAFLWGTCIGWKKLFPIIRRIIKDDELTNRT